MGEFPSGQRGQTVNLLRFASMVRIRPPPPMEKVLEPLRFLGFFFFLFPGFLTNKKLKNTIKIYYLGVRRMSGFFLCLDGFDMGGRHYFGIYFFIPVLNFLVQ